MTAADAADAEPVPTALVAVTVNVYALPLVRPLAVADVADPPTCTGVPATPPVEGVTV